MVRYNVRVNYGSQNITKKFFFVHKDWQTISKEDSDEAFNNAITELNRVYKTYGRFATQTGVIRLFESFGFEVSLN